MTHARDVAIGRLHDGVDPFAGFAPGEWADPTDEWDSHHIWFDEMVTDIRPRVLVEAGSFLGASSRHFANRMERESLDGVVVCVDTWLAERILWTSPQWRPHLRHVNGRPEAYKVWMANALLAGLEGFLCPLPMDSRAGARFLASRGMSADMVYIDASHEEGDVYQDLSLYYDLVLRPGGWMLVDDYQYTPDFIGVVNDVDRFVLERRLHLELKGSKARFRKAG
jgi:hypothetical protein